MNIALVDDIALDREAQEDIFLNYAAQNHLDLSLSLFSCAEDLLRDYRPRKYTVIFLDVFMDRMSGIKAAERIRDVDDDTLLVFLTTSQESQMDAIHWHVYDYILKSDREQAIPRVMDRILKRSRKKPDGKRFSFSCNRQNYAVCYADIAAIQADGNNTVVKTGDRTEYRPRMTFSAAGEELLQDNRFLEINRGIIVNMDYIADLTGSTCLLKDGELLPVSLRNRKSIIGIWRSFLFAQARNDGGGAE
ncbi:MAG: response regulator transcription factor [Clostridia bacterium]|nr:response regulator transcription factor [Clostridia bacterium]